MGKDIFSKKSRFSIRKLNIGVCSVLLGTLIMIGHTAQADETTSDGATVAATAVSASQGEGVSTTTSPSTAPESAATATVHQQLLKQLQRRRLHLQAQLHQV